MEARRRELDSILARGLPSETFPVEALADLKARWKLKGQGDGISGISN